MLNQAIYKQLEVNMEDHSGHTLLSTYCPIKVGTILAPKQHRDFGGWIHLYGLIEPFQLREGYHKS